MGMIELVDAIGRYGLPTVSAGIILWLYLQAERRAAERMDRWERRLLGDGNGRPGRLDELGHQVAAVARQVDTLVARAELSDERRIECERTFKHLHDSIACLQSELADHSERLDRVESVVLSDADRDEQTGMLRGLLQEEDR